MAAQPAVGIAKEQAWIQHTPMGDMAIIYWEAENPQRALEEMARSQDEFDIRFRQFLQEAHGVDVTQEQAPISDLVFDWQAKAVTGRGAICPANPMVDHWQPGEGFCRSP